MSDVLTLYAMRHDPEAALTFPLPPRPSVELLDEARQDILDHLDELTCDLDDEAPVEEVRRAMERATTRLLEISLRLPAARAAELEADAKELEPEPEPDDPDFEPPGEVWRDERRLSSLLPLNEGIFERAYEVIRAVPRRTARDELFIVLSLASRCLLVAEELTGESYPLDPKADAALDEAERELERADADERGFGPWEPPASRNILCPAGIK
jgi:hypothetical protein